MRPGSGTTGRRTYAASAGSLMRGAAGRSPGERSSTPRDPRQNWTGSLGRIARNGFLSRCGSSDPDAGDDAEPQGLSVQREVAGTFDHSATTRPPSQPQEPAWEATARRRPVYIDPRKSLGIRQSKVL